MNKLIVLTGAGVVGSVLLAAVPAGAAPATATQAVPLSCDNGVTLVVQVDSRGLPTRNGWVDGRAIVARAFARTESGTVHLSDGTTVDYTVDLPPSIDPGRGGRTHLLSGAELAGTTACRTPAEDFDFTITLSAEDVAYVGINASYAGMVAEVVGHGQTAVYVGTDQLAARS
jgi:hypothetical protein